MDFFRSFFGIIFISNKVKDPVNFFGIVKTSLDIIREVLRVNISFFGNTSGNIFQFIIIGSGFHKSTEV